MALLYCRRKAWLAFLDGESAYCLDLRGFKNCSHSLRGSAREDKWTQEVEEARGRYFLRKAAREAKGCWDL